MIFACAVESSCCNRPRPRARHAYCFERAIAIEPGYSEAHRWLALSYDLTWTYGAGSRSSPITNWRLRRPRKAIELDPNDAAAHAMLATMLEPSRRWEEAEAEFATALKLDPNSANSWALLSEFLVLKGQPAEAIAAIEKGIAAQPAPTRLVSLVPRASPISRPPV